MPNGRVFPSATGGGLSRGTGAFLQTLITKRELELRERQLSQVDRQLSQQDRQLKFNEEVQALESLFKMIPHLPRGVPISELSGLQDLIQKGLPSLDIADPMIGQITLNERTFDTVIKDLAEARLDEISGTPEGNALIDRFTNQLTTGRGISTEALEAGEAEVLMDAELYANSFEALKEDPEAWGAVMKVRLGLQQPVMFTDPATGKDWSFETAQGAALTEDLMKHWSMLEFQWTSLGSKDQLDLARELMTQMEQFEEAIGRPTALQIIRSWNTQTQGEQAGSLTQGEGSWYDLYTSYVDSGDIGAIRAMQVFTGSAFFGEQTLEELIESNPVGFQAAVFGHVSGQVADAIGKEKPDQVLSLTRDILNSLESEFGVTLEKKFGRKFKLQFNNSPSSRFPGTSPGPTPIDPSGLGASPTKGGMPAPPSMPQLISDASVRMWETIDAYKDGTMSLDQVKERYSNPADRRFIIRMARGEGI